IDVGLGAAATYFTGGAGGIAGGLLLMAVGVDQITTGVWNIRQGKVGHGFSKLEQAVYDVTGSETAAFLSPIVASLGLSWGTSLARMGSRTGPMLGIINGDSRSALEAGALAIVRGEQVIPVVWQAGSAYESLVAALRSLAPGERLVVIGHGNARGVQLGGAFFDASLFTAAVRQAGATPGAIELIACSTAASPGMVMIGGGRMIPAASFAERLAEAIRVPVTAYATDIYPRFLVANGATTVTYYVGVTGPVTRFFHSVGLWPAITRKAFWGHTPAVPVIYRPTGISNPGLFLPIP
ncbi:MAG TPA: hypothetical protein VD866_15540, partial [Urbifossiella sp.]|nr:hypothetical protein [Urbifossiella sp.]